MHVLSMTTTVGVLALQGAFLEHLVLLRQAAAYLQQHGVTRAFEFMEVRNASQLARCDALIIPGGESTTISFVAAQSGLLEPLREFVKYAISSHHALITVLTACLQGLSQTHLGNVCRVDTSG